MDLKTRNTLIVSLSISAGILGGLFLMYKIHNKRLSTKFNEQLSELEKKYDLFKNIN